LAIWNYYISLRKRKSKLAQEVIKYKAQIEKKRYILSFVSWRTLLQQIREKEQQLEELTSLWKQKHIIYQKRRFINSLLKNKLTREEQSNRKANRKLKGRYFKKLKYQWERKKRIESALISTLYSRTQKIFEAWKLITENSLKKKDQEVTFRVLFPEILG
jgi:hypothetical protein